MKINDHSQDNYHKNLEKYALSNPQAAIVIDGTNADNYTFCYTHLGELNLCVTVKDQAHFFYDNDGAINEAREWMMSVPEGYQHLFLFGIGLGLYYLTIKNWLRKSPNHYLFILEDDFAVMKKFLETSLASEILADPQVYIQCLFLTKKNVKQDLYVNLELIVKGFLRKKFFITASKLYTIHKKKTLLLIREMLFNMSSWYIVRTNELLYSTELIFGNFYHNTIRQFKTYNGNRLKDKFYGMPAIICGAGPSIINDIPYLKTLENKAVIIASGTGMNVLNHHGIFPHFGTALDPTPSQGTRIKTNAAFEIPFLYRTRFHKESFDFLHGPKLRISGKSGYWISNWFNEKMSEDQELVKNFKNGISSTNFAIELARHMGCNPIFLVGCDLAYTDASRYPPMISAHPLDTTLAKFEIESKSEVLLAGKANSGQGIVTKLDWISEGKTITEVQHLYPHLNIFNCSLPGLKIASVPFLPLKDAIDKYMSKPIDIKGWIHAEIVQSSLEETKELCLETFNEWHASIKKCIDYYGRLQKEIDGLIKSKIADKELKPPYTSEIALIESELTCEPAFVYYISDLIEIMDNIAIRQKLVLRCHVDEMSIAERNMKYLEIDLNYIHFFKERLEHQEKLIKKAYKRYKKSEEILNDISTSTTKGFQKNKNDRYEVKNGIMHIEDSELSISLSTPFDPVMVPLETSKFAESKILKDEFITCKGVLNGEYKKFYENGALKGRCFYLEGQLHGPVKWFSQEGTILSECWYVKGLQEGKCYHYYLDGSIYCIQKFRDGKKEGVHEYFYHSGLIKSQIPYKNDQLHGKVTLFYSNGKKRRELNYIEGKLNGLEHFWDPSGSLIWEVNYLDNMPKGVARGWETNGQLMREYTYFDDHKHFNLKEWNLHGKLVNDENNVSENLKETAEKKAANIAIALHQLDAELVAIQTLTKEERRRLFY